MRALLERLNARLFDRMQAERNFDERRVRIAMFPGQIASLEPVVLEFVRAAFGCTGSDPAPLLRGVYFTSGTQEGTPFDRLTGTAGAGTRGGPELDAEPAAERGGAAISWSAC